MSFIVREFLNDSGRNHFREWLVALLVLLLFGGDKGSQTKDIERAKAYWVKYSRETPHGKTK